MLGLYGKELSFDKFKQYFSVQTSHSVNTCLILLVLVASELVKQQPHRIKGFPILVIPHYEGFERLEQTPIEATEMSAVYIVEAAIMRHIFQEDEFPKKFNFQTMKYNHLTSRFSFTKRFNDLEHAKTFDGELEQFFCSIVKETLKIPEAVCEKVKDAVESKRQEFEAVKVEFSFDGFWVILVGEKKHVAQRIETINNIIEEVQRVAKELEINDKEKLKFLDFIEYFKKIMDEFPRVKIQEQQDGSAGKFTLVGVMEEIQKVKTRILDDITKISRIEHRISYRQLVFLERTDCQTVNKELKKREVMLILKDKQGVARFQATSIAMKKTGPEVRLQTRIY